MRTGERRDHGRWDRGRGIGEKQTAEASPGVRASSLGVEGRFQVFTWVDGGGGRKERLDTRAKIEHVP